MIFSLTMLFVNTVTAIRDNINNDNINNEIDLGFRLDEIDHIFHSGHRDDLFNLADVLGDRSTKIVKNATYLAYNASEISQDLKDSQKLLRENIDEIKKFQNILKEYDSLVSIEDDVKADIKNFQASLKSLEISMKPESFKKNMERKNEISQRREEIKSRNDILNKMESENITLKENVLEDESNLRRRFPNVDLGVEKKIKETEDSFRRKTSELRTIKGEIEELKVVLFNFKETVDRSLRNNGKIVEEVEMNRKFLKDFQNGTFDRKCKENQEKIALLKEFLFENNIDEVMKKELKKLKMEKNEILNKINKEIKNMENLLEKKEGQSLKIFNNSDGIYKTVEDLKMKITEFHEENFEFFKGVMLKKNKINLKMVDLFEKTRLIDMKIGEIESDFVFHIILVGGISIFVSLYGLFTLKSK